MSPRKTFDEPARNPATGDPLAGTPYRTVSRIGEGGMGEVYLAEHTGLGQMVVVKVLLEEMAADPEMVDRVRLEREALVALRHPNLVLVSDSGCTPNGRPFMVMERLVGCTLQEEIVRRGSLPLPEGLEIVRGVLAGLGAAHAIGLVHRDVKPANIFLHRVGNGPRVPKLLDFGMAKVVAQSLGGPHPLAVPTMAGSAVGTPSHMAPEQALGRRVDARTDLYAVALVLYRLIAGRGPFDDRSEDARIAAAHVHHKPLPPSHFSEQLIPPELDMVVLKGLRKDPDKRYQSATEMSHALLGLEFAFREPAGWLATTAFDGSEFAAGKPPSQVRMPRAPRPQDQAQAVPAESAQAQPVVAPASAEGDSPTSELSASIQTGRGVAAGRAEHLLFAAGLILTATLGAGVVAWLATAAAGGGP
ncbi:MAG: serine/threonine protein kinase [Polyangiaceae bacterium]|nr:serine/threonine protein kinase [Polyangiaceae bacterium]